MCREKAAGDSYPSQSIKRKQQWWDALKRFAAHEIHRSPANHLAEKNPKKTRKYG